MNINFSQNDVKRFKTRNLSQSLTPQRGISFTGGIPSLLSKFAKGSAVQIDNYSVIQKTLNKSYDGLFGEVLEEVKQKAPKLIKESDGALTLQEQPFLIKLWDNISYPFLKMPLDLMSSALNKLSEKFPASKIINNLNGSEFVNNYRTKQAFEQNVRSITGILKKTNKFANKALKETPNLTNDALEKQISGKVLDFLDKVFDQKTGNYNTRDERTLNRLITAFIPAFFLANDVYNMSKRNNASDEDAKKSANKRFIQETGRAVSSSYLQFSTLGACNNFVNSSEWGAPLINAASAFTSETISRLAVGKSLTPIELDDVKSQGDKPNTANETISKIDINNFINQVKTPGVSSITFTAEPAVQQKLNSKTEKRHLLSKENILKYVALSIFGGYALKYGSRGVKKLYNDFTKKYSGNLFSKAVSCVSNKCKNLLNEKFLVEAEDLENLFKKLEKAGKNNLVKQYREILKVADKESDKGTILVDGIYNLGGKERTVSILKQEIAVKDLLRIPGLPIKLVKEFLSYPYQAVQKIFAGISGIKSVKGTKAGKILADLGGVKIESKKSQLGKIRNLYTDYIKHPERYSDDKIKEYLKRQILRSGDETISSVNNKQLGKMTKLLTTVATTYFVILDDYNLTLEQTKNKDEAAHAGRDRFVQKMMRTFTQIGLMDIFNGVFKAQYNNSLAGALSVAAANTVATDCMTRYLSGKPVKRMTKEQQEEFDKNREKGVAGGYFKFIKKLAE